MNHRGFRRAWSPVALGLALLGGCSSAFGGSSDALQQQILAGLVSGQDVSALMRQAKSLNLQGGTPVPGSNLTQQLHGAEMQLLGALQQATSGNAPTAAGVGRVMDAYTSYQALVLLQQDDFAKAAKVVSDQGVGGDHAARVAQAKAAFTAVVEGIQAVLSPCQSAISSAQGGAASLDKAGLSTCGSAFAKAAGILQQNQHSASPHILRANTLPFRSAQLAPRALPTTPAIRPAYLNGPNSTPQAADIGSSADAPISKAVAAKATSLGNDYVKLYEFVRNSVRTEWYAGAQKGPDGVLSQGAGNDVDQASLLIALYRASGIPARYVSGVIQMPAATVAQDLGLTTASQASAALTKAGIPFSPVIQGGQVAALQLSATWVEAYVPYTNYRGTTVDASGSQWIALMPAIKQYQITAAAGLLSQVGVIPPQFVGNYLQAPSPQTPLDQLRATLQNYLSRNPGSGTDYATLLGSIQPAPVTLGLLPSSLPVSVVSVQGEEAVLTDGEQQHAHLQIRIGTGDQDPVVLDYTAPLSSVDGQRITLSYLPASQDDQQLTNFYGGLNQVPLYLIQVRPQLSINGVVVAYGKNALNPGDAHRVDVTVSGPAGSQTAQHLLTAGGLEAISINGQQAEVQADTAMPAPDDTDSVAGKLLYRLAVQYASDWFASEAESAALFHVAVVRPLPSVVIVDNDYNPEAALGQLQALKWEGVTIDAALHAVDPIPVDSSGNTHDWMQFDALQGSALEQTEFTNLFQVEGISADKGLALATQQGMPLVQVTSQNAGTVLPTLGQPAAVVANIQAWINQGLTVTVPQGLVALNDWSGSIWRVEDPQTGAAGYFIAGGLAGGSSTPSPSAWTLSWLSDALQAAGLIKGSNDPLSAASIQKIYAGDWQSGVVNQDLPIKIGVQVRNADGIPVQNAAVSFVVSAGNGLVNGQGATEVLTDPNGIATVTMTPGQHTSDSKFYTYQHPGDANPTRAGLNQIEASVQTASGSLSAEPFSELGFPDVPAKVVEARGEQSTASPPPQLIDAGTWDAVAVQVQDQYGNSIANTAVSAKAGAMNSTCTLGPLVTNLKFFDDSGNAALDCIANLKFSCASDTASLKTGPEGVVFGIVMGNSVDTNYNAVFTSNGFSLTAPLKSEGQTCASLITGYYQFLPQAAEETDESLDTRELVKPGGTYHPPLYVQFFLKLQGSLHGCPDTGNPTVVQISPTIDTGDARLSATNGGFVSSSSGRTGNELKYFVTGGSSPAFNDVMLDVNNVTAQYQTDCSGALTVGPFPQPSTDGTPNKLGWHSAINTFATVDAVITGVESGMPGGPKTADIPLDPTTHTPLEPSYLLYNILPDGLTAATAYSLLQVDGDTSAYSSGSARSGSGKALIPRDTVFDLTKNNTAVISLNGDGDGSIPLRSDPYKLPLTIPLFSSVSSVHISEDIDIVNQYTCGTSGLLSFTLVEDAKVTVTFVDAVSGAEIQFPAVQNEDLPAGTHSYPVTLNDMPPGRYLVEISGERDRDGYKEDRKTNGISEYVVENALPVGHPIVKGVDLFDSGLSVGGEDFAVQGRMPLTFSHHYSSLAGSLPGAMGIGWVNNWESHITIDQCGRVLISGGDGSGMRFEPMSDGSLKPFKGYHGTLIANLDRSFDFYSLDGTQFHYSNHAWVDVQPEWNLDYIKDTNGNFQSVTYVPQPGKYPRIASVIDSNGSSLSFTYADKTLQVLTPVAGTLPQDQQAATVIVRPMLTKVTGPQGLEVDFTYDDYGRLVAASRENAARVEQYSYQSDPLHQPIQIANMMTGYQNDNKAAIGGTPHSTTYTYHLQPVSYQLNDSSTGTPVSVTVTPPMVLIDTITSTDADPVTFTFDSVLHHATVTDGTKNVSTYKMNAYGNPVEIDGPESLTTYFQWKPDDILLDTRTDPNGTKTYYEYNTDGEMTLERVTGPLGDIYKRSWGYWKDSSAPYIKNRVNSKIDRNLHETVMDYEPRTGNLLYVRDAEGKETDYRYYPATGDRQYVIYPKGNYTHFLQYDPLGNVEKTQDISGATTAFGYDHRGRKTSVTDARSNTTIFYYDDLGYLTEKDNPKDFGKVSYVFDTLGNKLSETNEGNVTTTYKYDGQGRLIQINHPDMGVKYITYDGQGNKTTESDWTGGHLTGYGYDNANRLTSRTDPVVSDSDDPVITNYVPDAAGNITEEDDPRGGRITYTYDGLNRVLQKTTVTVDPVNGPKTVVTSFTYDGENKLTEVDGNQNTTTLHYFKNNWLMERDDPMHRSTTYTYDNNGNIATQTDSNGHTDQYVRDERSRTVTHTDPRGGIWTNTYDEVGNLKSVVDPLQNTASYTYDAMNRKTTYVDFNKASWGYDYNPQGDLITETWPSYEAGAPANTVTHGYDSMHRLTSTTDLLTGTTVSTASGHDVSVVADTTHYDVNGFKLDHTDSAGHFSRWTPDERSRIKSAILPQGRSVDYRYDGNGNRVSEKNDLGQETTYVYDTRGLLVQQTDFAGQQAFDYDGNGNQVQAKDRNGNIVTTGYDALNRVTSRTDSTGAVTTNYADPYDFDVTVYDHRRIPTETLRDPNHNVTDVTRAGVKLWHYGYDLNNHRVSETDANGNTTIYGYDAMGNLNKESRPEAATTQYVISKSGLRLTRIAPEGEVTQYAYDPRHRLLSETLKSTVGAADEVTQYRYDGNANRVETIKPDGNAWGYVYDGLDRLTEVDPPAVSTGSTAPTTYQYDSWRLTGETDANGNATTYGYDNANRRTDLFYPGSTGAHEHYTLDGNGNRIGLVDANQQSFTYVYDALDRLTSRTGGGLSTSYVLDGNGNATQITNTDAQGTKQTVRSYDSFDRLQTETDGNGQHLTYGYYPNGTRKTLTSGSGATTLITQYGIDGLNRIISVSQGSGSATSYRYDRDSRLRETDYPNGSSSTVDSVDQAGRPLMLTHSANGAPFGYYTYSYDLNGNRLTETLSDGQYNTVSDRQFTYDAADRLIQASYSDTGSTTWHYDAVGNRTGEQGTDTNGASTVSRIYSYNARNELTGITDNLTPANSIGYAYDANGNQTGKTQGTLQWTYGYDARDELTGITQTDTSSGSPVTTTVGQYRYDADGLRTDRQSTATGSEHYTWDDHSLLLTFDDAGTYKARYRYGPMRLESLNTGSGAVPMLSWYFFDALGSVTDVLGNSGSLDASYRYDAWGRQTVATGASVNQFGFTGHQRDAESGLSYFKARFYDPDVGRFLTEDSYEGKQDTPPSLHRYLYAYDNPEVYWDADGHAPLEDFQAIQDEDAVRLGVDPDTQEGMAAINQYHKAEGRALFDRVAGAYDSAKAEFESMRQKGLTGYVKNAVDSTWDTIKNSPEAVKYGYAKVKDIASGKESILPAMSEGPIDPEMAGREDMNRGIDIVETVMPSPDKGIKILQMARRGEEVVDATRDAERLKKAEEAVLTVEKQGEAGVAGHVLDSGAARRSKPVAAKGGTYVLKDGEGVVKRTGRTNDLARREAEHGRNHPDYTFEVDKRTDSYAAQRGREQIIHDANPSAHAKNGGLDRVNGISPKNPKRKDYLRAGQELQ